MTRTEVPIGTISPGQPVLPGKPRVASCKGGIENPGPPCESGAFWGLGLRPSGRSLVPSPRPAKALDTPGHSVFMSTARLPESAGFCPPGGCLVPMARCLCTSSQ